MMKTETQRPNIRTVQRCIDTCGAFETVNRRGETMRIRQIWADRGWWMTDHFTSDMRGRMGYKTTDAKLRITREAADQLARADEITAKNTASVASFLDR